MASKAELIAAHKSVEEICEYIGADSLGYLSPEGLIRAVEQERDRFCMACFTGEYPIQVQLQFDKLALERPKEAVGASTRAYAQEFEG
jgi:amidophosphoribosyltransferase